ncbi:putative PPM-type phosphatase domain superfamily [Helianthus debilis subsp. tardiflorus]
MRTLKEAMVEKIIDGFFGVYDGLSGSKATEYVEKNMHSNVFDLCITTEGNLISERNSIALGTSTRSRYKSYSAS